MDTQIFLFRSPVKHEADVCDHSKRVNLETKSKRLSHGVDVSFKIYKKQHTYTICSLSKSDRPNERLVAIPYVCSLKDG